MRVNLPVTHQEYVLPEGETLMSTTDRQGNITYANEAFSRASGYSIDELMGQPHNMVRHPDMPGQAFSDMWQTIANGYPWSGLVKNRRKNGDHYWVRANAAPMMRNGEHVGYISVRTVPKRAEVDAAESLYRQIRNGQAHGLAIQNGLVVRTGARRLSSTLQVLSTAWRLRLAWMLAATAMGLVFTLSPIPMSAAVSLWAALVLVLFLSAWFIEAQVSSPLRQIVCAAQQVASGERPNGLSFDRCDDIGVLALSINQAGLNLHSLVADTHEQIQGVHVASVEIADANSDLAHRTTTSAATLEQASAALRDEILSVQRNMVAAEQADEFADSAMQVASKGGETMDHVVTTMAEIAESSRKIVDIIRVIEGIAFQTNMLALNASVEAARAGEQGRGFAVVASEVRSLAGRAGSAAKEIKHLIEDAVGKVDGGTTYVAQAGVTMSEVVVQVRRVNDLMSEISQASQKQAEGISKLGQEIGELDTSTQQNAAMVEQTSASASSLSSQSKRLMDAIHVFAV